MRLNGARALMEIFRIEGVEYIFGLPGATEVQFMQALKDYPQLQYRLGLHETVVTGMAEGYSRASGKPGVLNLHTNTGLGAATPLLANAYNGGVPLIVTAGQQDTRLLASEPALTGDLVKLASQFTKWSTEVLHAEDIPMVFRRAFRTAVHPPSGPVFISLPQDTLEQEIEFEYFRSSPLYTQVHPQAEAIDLAAGLILRAQRPLLIVEDGISKAGAMAGAVSLAELAGARVYQPWMSDVNFPVAHPLYFGDLNESSQTTRQVLENADLIIAVGVDLFSQVVYFDLPLLPPDIPLIQIDSDPWEIGKNYPVTVGIEADIKLALADLNARIKQRADAGFRAEAKARESTLYEEKLALDKAFQKKVRKEHNSTPISTTRLMQEIKSAALPGTRIVDDCWSASATLRQTLAFSQPLSYFRSRNGGSIGWGLPGALGVKIGSPDSPVVCVSGDGSALWSIQSLWTAARYQIPVTFVILANGCYQMVRNMSRTLLGGSLGSELPGTDLCLPQNDFCRIAEGMGLPARRVTKPGDLKKAISEAFRLNRPNLVEVLTDSAPR
jgi:benzoylformate decarboxylase